GSNIPEITKRFCSSQGDQVVINVPGVCLATRTEPGTCAGEDSDPSSDTRGAIADCYPSADPAQQTTANLYKQVITVYLRQPLAVCGNAVCESPTEDPTSCPSDCHPGSWAREFDAIAVNPAQEPIVIGGAGAPLADQQLMSLSAIAPDDQGVWQDVVV